MIKFGVRLKAVNLTTFGWGRAAILGPDIQFARKGGCFYIPGSSLKGALRSAASRIAECYNFTSCGETRPELRPESERADPCHVCRLFGMPGSSSPGPLFVGDLEFTGKGGRFSITKVRLEDKTQRAEEGGLYTQEHVYDAEFQGEIIIVQKGRLEKRLLGLLLLSMAELRTGRAGRDAVIDLKLEGTDQFEHQLESEWLGLLGQLKKWLWEGKHGVH